MPEVDFMILCDYVRPEGGIMHILGGGIDKIDLGTFPAVHNIGIAIRLTMTRAECGRTHEIELVFQDTDGRRMVGFSGSFNAIYPDGVPPGWPAHGVIPINMGIPLPAAGMYSFELLIDGNAKKSLPLLVTHAAPPLAVGSTDAD
jgi:hypothetical protein